MHRIDTPTAQKDKFGAGKNGFTRGNPQTGTPATDLDDDYFDMLQEELAGIIEDAGIALDKSKHNQLRTALPLFLGLKTAAKRDVGTGVNQIPDMSSWTSGSGWIKFPDGTIIQSGTANRTAGQIASTTLPIPFTNAGYIVLASLWASDPAPSKPVGAQSVNLSTIQIANWSTPAATIAWIAIGK